MTLPAPLNAQSQQAREQIEQQYPNVFDTWPQAKLTELDLVLGLSDFIADSLQRDEKLCQRLPEMLAVQNRSIDYRDKLKRQLAKCEDEASLNRKLRQFRRREMCYIAWRDFVGSWSLRHASSFYGPTPLELGGTATQLSFEVEYSCHHIVELCFELTHDNFNSIALVAT